MKKILALFTALCISGCSFSVTAFASRYNNCADTMSQMGIFKGVAYDYGVEYELGRGARRSEALVMLLRLLGEEEVARNYTSGHKFTDVLSDNWASPYVAYAVDKGYTSGISEFLFGPNNEVNLKTFATFLLRALGYNDRIGDFIFDRAIDKAVEAGILPEGVYKDGSAVCLRDDCVYMSIRALNSKMKNTNTTLAETLIAKGVIPGDSVNKIIEAAYTADQHLVSANKSPNKIIAEDAMTYAEFDSNNRAVKRMHHVVYFNSMAKYLYHYTYDANGNLIKKMSTDSAASNSLYEFDVDDSGKTMSVDFSYFSDYTPDGELSYTLDEVGLDASYSFEYDDTNRLTAISNDNREDENIEIRYVDNLAYLTADYYLDDVLSNLDALEIKLPGIEKARIKTSDSESQCIVDFDSKGMIIGKRDEKDRLTYLAEQNSNGKLTKEYLYEYVSGGSNNYYDSWSGSDSQSSYEYTYNPDGTLSKVVHIYDNGTEEFTFRYFGNGKLDRVLWKGEDGVTWEQVHTAFDEYGHMKAPW